jgi:ribonuclease HI
VKKTSSSFNFESDMAKINISIPFNELIKNGEYRNQIIKMLKMEQTSDTLNIKDDHPAILFVPFVKGNRDAEEVPPFYVSMNIHDMTLHNVVLDSRESHNLIPNMVMDQLVLDITRTYKDLFSFDSRKMKLLGIIKDLVVSLSQNLAKKMVMDVVVVDIPPKFGMLLSRSWSAKLKGTLQMDMSYTTILVFGQYRRFCREVLLKYMVSNKAHLNKHPFYFVENELGSSIFFNDLCFEEKGPEIDMIVKDKYDQQIEKISEQQDGAENEMWSMGFYGAVSREGAGASVWINPPRLATKLCSYKLDFDCTNNMVEYEALVLGLKDLKEMGAKRIVVHGDSELIINQVKGIYQAKHPILRAYRNTVLDLLEEFSKYSLSVIPRGQNQIDDALTNSASVFKIPIFPSRGYEVDIKHRPTVPHNIKYWQVFEYDKQIESFLKMEDGFENLNIDEEYCDGEVDADVFTKDGYFKNQISGRDILQLKINIIPKGLVPLEKPFYNNVVAMSPKLTVNEGDVEDWKIQTQEDPKIIKLSKTLSP